MVFQDPSTSLHPMLTIGASSPTTCATTCGLDKRRGPGAGRRTARQGPHPRPPRSALRRYPHQFSGGSGSAIAIAIALACDPQVLIADEPTTALDVTVQAGVLRLLRGLVRRTGAGRPAGHPRPRASCARWPTR